MGDPISLLFLGIIFVLSITVHEFAHAWSSDKLWDPTPRMQWRVTINPVAHIDPLGFLAIFLIQFWWWRPVQVNPNYYKNRLRDELLVALAGPISNIILALISIVFVQLYVWVTGLWIVWWAWVPFVQFWTMFGIINCWLAVFNMIPIPPLDGYRVITYIWPRTEVYMIRRRQYFWIILLALIFLPRFVPWIPNIWRVVGVVSQLVYGILNMLVSFVFYR